MSSLLATPSRSNSPTQARQHYSSAVLSTESSSVQTFENETFKASDTDSAGIDGKYFDFIGCSARAVKNILTLPYMETTAPLSVAIHNFDGTLLIDVDPAFDRNTAGESSDDFKDDTVKAQVTGIDWSAKTKITLPKENHVSNNKKKSASAGFDSHPHEDYEDLSRALVALSSLEKISDISSGKCTEALSLVKSAFEDQRAIEARKHVVFVDEEKQSMAQQQYSHYHHQIILPPPENPREFLTWTFAKFNLLVGSDALIYRSPDSHSALAVRVEDVRRLQAMLQQHDANNSALTYADMARRNLPHSETLASPDPEDTETCHQPDVPLQSCVISMPHSPVGGLLNTSTSPSPFPPNSAFSSSFPFNSTTSTSISTVLDVYLDNIMASVPQLALCLQDKGFIQSVKLLATDDVPSHFIHPNTLDISTPFAIVDRHDTNFTEDKSWFSPQCIESHASTLLRFLKSHCTRDHGTYLLRRDAGQTTIRLYDVSKLSNERQRKWVWWLAMMSLRFSQRLGQLLASDVSSSSSRQQTCNTSNSNKFFFNDAALQRDCRARQRRLLETTLELLDVITDIDGTAQESLISAVHENLADLYLSSSFSSFNKCDDTSSNLETKEANMKPHSLPTTFSSLQKQRQQQYANISVDALTKGQDHLTDGIKSLMPKLNVHLGEAKMPVIGNKGKSHLTSQATNRSAPLEEVLDGFEEDNDDFESDIKGCQYDLGVQASAALKRCVGPMVSQLLSLHYKFVNVSLRLAEIHLRNYYSSSAMQALRAAARRIADSLYLVHLLSSSKEQEDWYYQIQPQFTWLWEHCGHFARSFAGDELWRDRGHASGDDIISVLQDVERAFAEHPQLRASTQKLLHRFIRPEISIVEKSKGWVHLKSLTGLVNFQYLVDVGASKKTHFPREELDETSLEAASKLLNNQQILLRDKRRVLVAACISYCRAIQSFRYSIAQPNESETSILSVDKALLGLLRQRLGDACNETGKIILNELRSLLTTSSPETNMSAARPLLAAAQFWFYEGLEEFEQCQDLRNLALLRCNLCQSYKLQANTSFASVPSSSSVIDSSKHAEMCLQEAANHLQAAHISLGERDTDPHLWDMVSEELAATFLVLGVRRRQSLIGTSNIPVIMQALRLSPGMEHSIVDPMQRALIIYVQLGNQYQVAATQYQLALFFSKIWTCQCNETRTREKLSAAFHYYRAAHSYFSRYIRGNEVTFCLLCCDLSNLYAAVAGGECSSKALLCYLDAADAFSKDALIFAKRGDKATQSDWFSKMDTLSATIDERVFKLLRTLVKLEEEDRAQAAAGKYKSLYRAALMAKLKPEPFDDLADDEMTNSVIKRLLNLHNILVKLREEFSKAIEGTNNDNL